jgi:deoxyribonuclease V
MSIRPVLFHPWHISPAGARQIQAELRQRVRSAPLARAPIIVAGVDVCVQRDHARAAVVLHEYPELRLLQTSTAEMAVSFPYVPGLLAFREGPVILAALEQLAQSPGHPDVLIFDAHGLAHPRRLGLASHLGVLLDAPTVGCAKSRLCGDYVEPGPRKGSQSPLVDGDEVIGAVVRTRDNVRPVFVSVGHRIDLETAVSLVLNCTTRYRLPEPTRWAHRIAGEGAQPSQRRSGSNP